MRLLKLLVVMLMCTAGPAVAILIIVDTQAGQIGEGGG
jgi:hypothetical protein